MLNDICNVITKMWRGLLIVLGILVVIEQIDIATGNAISRWLLKR